MPALICPFSSLLPIDANEQVASRQEFLRFIRILSARRPPRRGLLQQAKGVVTGKAAMEKKGQMVAVCTQRKWCIGHRHSLAIFGAHSNLLGTLDKNKRKSNEAVIITQSALSYLEHGGEVEHDDAQLAVVVDGETRAAAERSPWRSQPPPLRT